MIHRRRRFLSASIPMPLDHPPLGDLPGDALFALTHAQRVALDTAHRNRRVRQAEHTDPDPADIWTRLVLNRREA